MWIHLPHLLPSLPFLGEQSWVTPARERHGHQELVDRGERASSWKADALLKTYIPHPGSWEVLCQGGRRRALCWPLTWLLPALKQDTDVLVLVDSGGTKGFAEDIFLMLSESTRSCFWCINDDCCWKKIYHNGKTCLHRSILSGTDDPKTLSSILKLILDVTLTFL